MPIERHFLGWDGPIADKAGAWLLGNRPGGQPADFQDTLIVVPTLQAGRRLKETLARMCHEGHSALVSAAIVTPNHFFSRIPPGARVASPSLARVAWADVLGKADAAEFSSFFPGQDRLDKVDRFKWALSTGEAVEHLRRELADGGYSIADVIARHGKDLQEPDRWGDLAALEERYLRALAEMGFRDACREQIALAGRPVVEEGVRRIVVACVPDPAELALRALRALSTDRRVDLLVHAPESSSASFDEWGRPDPGAWAAAEIDIPGWERNVFLEASPAAQAARVMEILAGLSEQYGPADVGIGAPDPAVVPFLQKELKSAGLQAFDPSDVFFGEHPLGRLVETAAGLLQSRAYRSVADLLRHPDFLGCLKERHGIAPRDLLVELDEFQNYRLPGTLAAMLAHSRAGECPALAAALKVVGQHVADFDALPLEVAWRKFLQSVYAGRRIVRDSRADGEFEQAAGIVEDTLREMREVAAASPGIEQRRLQGVFCRRLRERAYHRERGDESIDAQGWLELPWTDAPVLIVAGMNEEFVPGGSLGGVFLPDSLRKTLGLRDDLARLSRDAYILAALAESRRARGRLCLIAGKYSLAGDPLRPSRLLFRCAERELPARSQKLFRAIEPSRRAPAQDVIFQLRPAAAERDAQILEGKRIPVTALRDYLECPFRFYLKHVLRMESVSDDKMEPDALDFGAIVHEVLQAMGSDRRLWACADAGELGDALGALAEGAMTGRYGRQLPLGAMVALSSIRARLKALADVQVGLAAGGWEIVAVERKESVELEGFTVSGKIDRMDRHKPSGLIRIIDYKTSNEPLEPRAAHLARRREGTPDYNRLAAAAEGEGPPHARDPRGAPAPGRKQKAPGRPRAATGEWKWIDLQLPLYRLFCAGGRPLAAGSGGLELAYFNLPKAVSRTGIEPWAGYDESAQASAERCARGALKAIAAGIFWPPSGKTAYDDDFETLFFNAPEQAFDLKGFAP